MFKEISAIIFCFLVGTALFLAVVYCLDSCFRSSYEVTESSSDYTVNFNDIQYKGHTYIYVHGSYSRSIVHAAHCKCFQNK